MLSSRKGGLSAAVAMALGLGGLAYAAEAMPSIWANPAGPALVGTRRKGSTYAKVKRSARKARRQAAHRAACKRKGH